MDCDTILYGAVALVAIVAGWFVLVGVCYGIVRFFARVLR